LEDLATSRLQFAAEMKFSYSVMQLYAWDSEHTTTYCWAIYFYAELISPCVSYVHDTLHSQAAVWAKAYCVTLSLDVKF
jgi:hypothetical protein